MIIPPLYSHSLQLTSTDSAWSQISEPPLFRTHSTSDLETAVAALQVLQDNDPALVPRHISSTNTSISDANISLDRVHTRHVILVSLIGIVVVVLSLSISMYFILRKRYSARQTEEQRALHSPYSIGKPKMQSATLHASGTPVSRKPQLVLNPLSALPTRLLSYLKMSPGGLTKLCKLKRASSSKETKNLFQNRDGSRAGPAHKGILRRKEATDSREPSNVPMIRGILSKYPFFAASRRIERQFFMRNPHCPLTRPSGRVLSQRVAFAIPEIKVSEAMGSDNSPFSTATIIPKSFSSSDTFNVELNLPSPDTSQPLLGHSNLPLPRSIESDVHASSVKKKPVPLVMLRVQNPTECSKQVLGNRSTFRPCGADNSPAPHPDFISNTPNLVPSVETRSSLVLPSSASGLPDSLSDCSVISSTVDYSEFLLPQNLSLSDSPSPYIPDLSIPLSAPDPKTGQVTLANGWTPMFGRSSTLYGRSTKVLKLHDELPIEQTEQLQGSIGIFEAGNPISNESPSSNVIVTCGMDTTATASLSFECAISEVGARWSGTCPLSQLAHPSGKLILGSGYAAQNDESIRSSPLSPPLVRLAFDQGRGTIPQSNDGRQIPNLYKQTLQSQSKIHRPPTVVFTDADDEAQDLGGVIGNNTTDMSLSVLLPPVSNSCMTLSPQYASPSCTTLSTAISSTSATSSLNFRLEHESLTPRFMQIYNVLEAGERSCSLASLLTSGSSQPSDGILPLSIPQPEDLSYYHQLDKNIKSSMRGSKSSRKSQTTARRASSYVSYRKLSRSGRSEKPLDRRSLLVRFSQWTIDAIEEETGTFSEELSTFSGSDKAKSNLSGNGLSPSTLNGHNIQSSNVKISSSPRLPRIELVRRGYF